MSKIDCTTYSGEKSLLKLRLEMLNPHVDCFVILESGITFSGKEKPISLMKDLADEGLTRYKAKMVHLVVEDFYDPAIMRMMARDVEFETTAHPFKMAYYQKESLQHAIAPVKDSDIIYYGDFDEIYVPFDADEPTKCEQVMYTYYLNLRTSEPWKGTVRATAGEFKRYGFNNLRKNVHTSHKNGWHFSNQGGLESLKRKIASYDHQEVNIPEVTNSLEERIKNKQDFLGRDYKLWIDEMDWPKYLKDNREEYKHLLCKEM